jgi:hypothetical protein
MPMSFYHKLSKIMSKKVIKVLANLLATVLQRTRQNKQNNIKTERTGNRGNKLYKEAKSTGIVCIH